MINLDTVVKARLRDGHHKVTLKDYQVENNSKGGYLRLNVKFSDRVHSWIVFPNQLDYVTGMLKTQFGWENEDKTMREILDHAVVTPFDIWTEVSSEYGNRNYSLSKPRVEPVVKAEQDVQELVTF